MLMRRLALASTLVLAACAARPEQPVVQTPPPVVARPAQGRSVILGLTASQLVGHFGNPALQVREGVGLKLQFRSNRCVLDAYLYVPESGGGVQRVTYVDTRLPSGVATDQAACISVLENPN
jgi:hypothetical protein